MAGISRGSEREDINQITGYTKVDDIMRGGLARDKRGRVGTYRLKRVQENGSRIVPFFESPWMGQKFGEEGCAVKLPTF